MARSSALVVSVGMILSSMAGCSFDVAGIDVGDGGTVKGPQDLAGSDQAFTAADLAGLCSVGGPQSGCSDDGSSLITCDDGVPTSMTCTMGCSNNGPAHCRGGLDPGGPATPGDYATAGLGDISINFPAVFDTDTGSVNSVSLQRNGAPGVIAGIGFRSAPQVDGSHIGIFSFHSLTILEGGQISFVGSNAASLVAAGDIQIAGHIDAQSSCDPTAPAYASAGAGGVPTNGTGGHGSGHGGGGGGVQGPLANGGGGGGGSGDSGGMGTTIGPGGTGGAGGMPNAGLSDPDPLLLGGGGGGAGSGTMSNPGGIGGAGGGAVQVAANGMIVLGAQSVIQAGGCHGNPSQGGGGGGGGGAGGALLLEATSFSIAGGAIIAANGGSGAGGGGDGQPGNDGADGSMVAQGGVGGGSGLIGAAGGDGGFSTSPAGEPGDADAAGTVSGGGGGGAVGNIAFKSMSGVVDTSAAIVSPQIGAHSPGQMSPSIIGVANFD